MSGTNISIPTHYFAVLTSCKDPSRPVSVCGGELQAVSFLLPHRADNSESCRVRAARSGRRHTQTRDDDDLNHLPLVSGTNDVVVTGSSCPTRFSSQVFQLFFRLRRQSSAAESHWVEDHMWFHQSRVRDVEWITGLDFYQGGSRPIPELLRLKTRPTAAVHRKP